jgi:hypothetical protein
VLNGRPATEALALVSSVKVVLAALVEGHRHHLVGYLASDAARSGATLATPHLMGWRTRNRTRRRDRSWQR